MSLFGKVLIATTVGSSIFLAICGVALAVNGSIPLVYQPGSDQPIAQKVEPTDAAVSSQFAAFRAPQSKSDASGAQELRNAFGESGSGRLAANADFAAAKSSQLNGSTDRAWIAPSGDETCVFLPDPVDGYATTCSSVDDVKAGRGVLVLTPQGDSNDPVRVAVLVADGDSAPSVVSSSGAKRTLAVENNIAAAEVPATSKLVTTAETIDFAGMVRADANAPTPVAR